MKLERHEWVEVLRHLDTALDLPEPERPGWIEALALPTPLADALRKLLQDRRAIETADFLAAGPSLALPVPPTNTVLGPWRLLRELGRGGMATVWLARREDGAHTRDVALKLPHPWVGSQVVLERFRRERRILSTLQHPHIAQVLDAGDSGGQPWLALEYVEGRTILEHASALQLSVPERLRLFLPVLRAVQHAHAQLVIHRDIKPANVLVDGNGSVKLLDFGVAKLLDDEASDTALTREGGPALTPQYASPEQLGGRPLGVASDVYALGVLLYELLTGRPPYQLPRGSAAALEQAVLAAQVALPSLAAGNPALRGDLDTLALKAMALEPAQRYASAEAMAQDIERHLASVPILARPAGLGLRLRKLMRRRRLPLLAGSAVVVAVALGAGLALWQADAARAEAARASAVQRFLVTLLQTADPQGGQARELSVGQLLDLNAGRIDREFADQPAAQAELLHTLANIYVERGEAAKGRPLLERALALYAAERWPSAAARDAQVQGLVDLAELQDELAEYDAERRTLAQAEVLATRHFGATHRWAAQLLAAQAWLAMNAGQLDEARRLGERAQASFGTPSLQSLRTAGSLATIYIALGDLTAAKAVLEQSQRDALRLGGEGSVDRLMTGYSLARVRFILGELQQAEAELAQLLPQFDRVAGPGQQRTRFARGLWAQVLAARGRMDEGVAEARSNLAAALAADPPDSDAVQADRATLANVLRQAGQLAEALPLAQTALADAERHHAQPTAQREAIRRVLGEVQLAAGQREAGVATLNAALQNVRALKTNGADLQQPIIQLLLAVATRDTGDLAARACAARAAQMDESRLPLLRCRLIQAWLAARQAPEAERPAVNAAFNAARDRLLGADLHPRHPLRAELLALEAELLPPGPASQALQREADRQYRALLGVPLPVPLWVLH